MTSVLKYSKKRGNRRSCTLPRQKPRATSRNKRYSDERPKFSLPTISKSPQAIITLAHHLHRSERNVRYARAFLLVIPCLDMQVDFVLQRHQSVDVRGLLEQDLLLLRDLCLSPAAAAAPENGHGGEGDADSVVDRCWRLHVGLLLQVLRRIPDAAEDSLDVVEHVALPCLEAVAAACLDGGTYPSLEAVDGNGDEEEARNEAERVRGMTGAANPRMRATRRPLGETLLLEVLDASANAWTTEGRLGGSVGTGGGGRGYPAVWQTPSQARNARVARRTWQRLASATTGLSTHNRGSARPPTEDVADTPTGSRFPNHWLLHLLVNRRSAVLRKFSCLVLGTLATSMGSELSEEMAEAAAHVLRCVAAEGSEAAALQVRNGSEARGCRPN